MALTLLMYMRNDIVLDFPGLSRGQFRVAIGADESGVGILYEKGPSLSLFYKTDLWITLQRALRGPLSSKCDTYLTVQATFWPWLSDKKT